MDDRLLEMFVKEIKLQCRFASAAYQGIVTQIGELSQRRNALNLELRRRSDILSEEIAAIYRNVGDSDESYEEALEQRRDLTDRYSQESSELSDDYSNWPVFYFVYSFLVHAAIVSKILWSGDSIHGVEKRIVGDARVDALKSLRSSRSETIRKALGIVGLWQLESKDLRNDLEHYDERIETWYLSSPRRNSMDMSIMPRSAVGGLDSMDFRRNLDSRTLAFYIEGNDYVIPEIMKELEIISGNATAWLRANDRRARRSTASPNESTEVPADAKAPD